MIMTTPKEIYEKYSRDKNLVNVYMRRVVDVKTFSEKLFRIILITNGEFSYIPPNLFVSIKSQVEN